MTLPPPSPPPRVTAATLGSVAHGFFTRVGGVSEGAYASLNGSMSGGDNPERVRTNRARVADALGIAPVALLGLTQVHGTAVITADAPWPEGAGGRADAMVTARPGLGLVVITADCAPVLFADPGAGVVGAAHAGWRGLAAGVIEATVEAMVVLGAAAERVRAAVGPCIGPASYEVGADMRDAVLGLDPTLAGRFTPAPRSGHFLFDLPGACLDRLTRANVGATEAIHLDTLPDEARFFSHRRRFRAGGGAIGHQMSAIRA